MGYKPVWIKWFIFYKYKFLGEPSSKAKYNI